MKRRALDAWNTLDSHLYGFTLQQLNLPFGVEETQQVSADVLGQIPAQEYPHVVEVITRIILFLADEFSPETQLHGTALDCYGVGCVLVGAPGVAPLGVWPASAGAGVALVIDAGCVVSVGGSIAGEASPGVTETGTSPPIWRIGDSQTGSGSSS
jgi:hypothetical protein